MNNEKFTEFDPQKFFDSLPIKPPVGYSFLDTPQTPLKMSRAMFEKFLQRPDVVKTNAGANFLGLEIEIL